VAAFVLLASVALVPNQVGGTALAATPRISTSPSARWSARFIAQPLSNHELSPRGAVLAPPPSPRRRPAPPDETCPALADPGFTARCGIARTKDGSLIWLIQTRTGGRGFRAQVLRPAGTELEVALEVVDEDRSRFDDIRASVADVSGDGSDDVSMSFYRKGSRQILSLDLVQSPGVVALHRDYIQGSARATAGQLEGWEAVRDGGAGGALLSHETITFRDGVWRKTATTTRSTAVFGQDFADPFLLRAGKRYYGYATNRGASNVPLITSTDLADWYSLPDALPQLPAWSSRGKVWAPAVLPRTDGYVLYYTTREQATGLQCLSRARATSPDGPFLDESTGPIVCQRDLNGSIDASPFVDADGTAYLVWKSEDAAGREPTRLWSQALSADGLSLVGSAVTLLSQDRPWELPTIEAPSLVRDGDRYYLFYSGGKWQTSSYAVGYATCSSPSGPCAKVDDAPLLSSSPDLTGPGGPGGAEVLVDAHGRRWLSFHAWVPFEGGYPAGRRMLHLSPLRFEGGQPVLGPVDFAGR
jgi:hypothetical protein